MLGRCLSAGILLCLSLLGLPSLAAGVEDDRVWLNINANGPTADPAWRWYAELQPRWRDEASTLDQTIARTALYFSLTKQSSVWFGYAHVKSEPANRPDFDENRLWQQYLYQFSPIDGMAWQSRSRLEQRWIEHSQETGHKFRQMLRLSVASSLHPSLAWVAYDEYFINLNSTDYGARKGFDQNRLFLGFNWALDDRTKLELGYLNQRVNTTQADSVFHVLSTTLNVNF
jgi:hypothetical protein